MIACFVCENLFVYKQTETNKPPGSIQKFEENILKKRKSFEWNCFNGKKLKMVVTENKNSPTPLKTKIDDDKQQKMAHFSVFIINKQEILKDKT